MGASKRMMDEQEGLECDITGKYVIPNYKTHRIKNKKKIN